MGKVVQLRGRRFERAAFETKVATYDETPVTSRTVAAFLVLGLGIVLSAMMPAAITLVAVELFFPS